ncbi:MAG: type II secretion system protein [Candidatus Omnitrophica bacterium]|nr:type II secretion system protein [Candidatus Omnitrophota bacterium]
MKIIRKTLSFTVLELLIVVCLVIFVLIGLFAVFAGMHLKYAREAALRNELNNIRSSIELYRVIKKRLPEDLASLFSQEFTFKAPDGKIIKNNFLKPFRLDKKGDLLDPFMNRYIYYPKEHGRVITTTKGYENW